MGAFGFQRTTVSVALYPWRRPHPRPPRCRPSFPLPLRSSLDRRLRTCKALTTSRSPSPGRERLVEKTADVRAEALLVAGKLHAHGCRHVLPLARPLQTLQLIDRVSQLALNTSLIANDAVRVIICGSDYSVELQSCLLPPPANCYLLDHHFLEPANRLKIIANAWSWARAFSSAAARGWS